MSKTLRAVQFLFTGPLILLLLYVVSRMTDSGGERNHGESVPAAGQSTADWINASAGGDRPICA